MYIISDLTTTLIVYGYWNYNLENIIVKRAEYAFTCDMFSTL